MLNSCLTRLVLSTGPFTRKSTSKNRANRFLLGTVLVLFMLGMPRGAQAQWVRISSYGLWEETNPAYARMGALGLYYNKTLTATPYGFPYLAYVNINGYCNSSGVTEYGGYSLAWMSGYTADYSVISPYDPYANQVWAFFYNAASGNGSYGVTLGCPVNTKYNTYGSHYFFARAPQYQTQFTPPPGTTTYTVVGDLALLWERYRKQHL